jgi:hypothetical protein
MQRGFRSGGGFQHAERGLGRDPNGVERSAERAAPAVVEPRAFGGEHGTDEVAGGIGGDSQAEVCQAVAEQLDRFDRRLVIGGQFR